MATETDVRTYYLSNVCHVCKAKKPEIWCEICHMIFYCSPEHRRENWYDHSELCRAIHKVCVAENLKHLYEKALNKSSDCFRDLKHLTATKCTKVLGRSLKSWEYELLYHPRVCNVCYESDLKQLKHCEGCEYEVTCQKNHFRKNHSKWCQKLRLYGENKIHQKLVAFPSIKSIPQNVKSMKEFVSQLVVAGTNGESHSEVRDVILSEILTYPLTVLHALKSIKENLENCSNITIYLVGAEMQAEVEPREKWETFLLHSLEKLKSLHLIFIGPELHPNSEKQKCFLMDVCENCRNQGRELKFEFAPGKLYHDFIRQREGIKQPDLICTLNSGMYRQHGFANQDSWKETIKDLFSVGQPPVLVTEYTSYELKEDIKCLKNQFPKLKMLLEHSLNPFASLKPGLNIISEQECPVIFKNYYCCILTNNKS